MPYFAISGRIPSDNLEFSFAFPARSREEAEDIFRQRVCDLNIGRYGNPVEIVHVFESQTPIQEV